MTFDVISVGGAAIDTFVTSSSPDIQMSNKKVTFPIGSKILLDSAVTDVGGAGVNTSISLSRLGLKSAFLGKLGNDHAAQAIQARLKLENVKIIATAPKGATGLSFILSGLEHDRTVFAYKGSSS